MPRPGHFGGPLAYTPYNVAMHLAGPELGGLRYDYRRPKHPYRRQVHAGRRALRPDLLRAVDDHGPGAGPQVQGHRRQALLRRSERRDSAHRRAGVPPRRGRAEDSAPGQRSGRSIRCSRRPKRAASRRCPATPKPSTSPTTSTAGRPAWASPRRPARRRSGTSWARRSSSPKIIAFEGEFALTEGHAQELKTQALALKVGKRLRVMLSDNNAGIDDFAASAA